MSHYCKVSLAQADWACKWWGNMIDRLNVTAIIVLLLLQTGLCSPD